MQYTTGNAFEYAIELLKDIGEEAVILPQFDVEDNLPE